jgi:hypothetical protein
LFEPDVFEPDLLSWLLLPLEFEPLLVPVELAGDPLEFEPFVYCRLFVFCMLLSVPVCFCESLRLPRPPR